jgi:dipeptidyl aminopeptidase/acylaminoacyl peptidase
VLYTAPFDLARLEPLGKAVVAAEGIKADPSFGSAQIAYASNGTLAYVPGRAVAPARPVDWISRDGKISTLRAEAAQWSEPRFSPDGRKLAMVITDGKQKDIWIYDIAGDRLTQFTTDAGNDRTPVWSSDSKRIVFTSDRAKPGGPANIYMANADGTGEITRLTDSQNQQVAFSWHPDQRFVFFQEQRPTTGWDLMVLPLEGTPATGWRPGTQTVFLSEPGAQLYPQISPDGRWVAYFGPEASGVSINVWVRPFPGPGGVWRVSEGAARFAKWSSTSRELLWVDPNARDIKVAPYTVVGNAFEVGKVSTWSPTVIRQGGAEDPFAVHPDGKRLAASAAVNESAVMENHVVFVFNFADYLNRIAPVRK